MIIRIEAYENGAHANQSITPQTVPEGWAEVPDWMEIPDTFPFVDVTAENGVVTSMTAGIVPEPEPEPADTPTELERLRADVDYIAIMTGVEL